MSQYDTTMWYKVPYRVGVEIERAAKKAKVTRSAWTRRIVMAHLNNELRLPKVQKLETPPESRLLTLKTNYGPNTPCLYKEVPMTLKDLAFRLKVSFMYIHNRLKKGDKLEQIVKQCEEDLDG